MKYHLAKLFYVLAGVVLWPVATCVDLMKFKDVSRIKLLNHRLGFCPAINQHPVVWLHGVSMGEVGIAQLLIDRLSLENPALHFMVTTVNRTGEVAARQRFADNPNVSHAYSPMDTPWAIQRFLMRTQPVLALMVETEIWPCWFSALNKRETPFFVVNARLSDSSAKGYFKIKALIDRTLRQATGVLTRDQSDAQCFAMLSPHAALHVCGNLKADQQVVFSQKAEGEEWRKTLKKRPVWLAASTHAGEEASILTVHKALIASLSSTLLVIAPRAPERFNEVAALLKQSGLTVARRSCQEKVTTQTQVYLADTLGELTRFYAACDVAFVGGTLVKKGGHNPLEATILKKPVCFGPHTYDAKPIYEGLKAAGGGVEVADAEDLRVLMQLWLSSPETAQKVGQLGGDWLQTQPKAIDCVFKHLKPYLML